SFNFFANYIILGNNIIEAEGIPNTISAYEFGIIMSNLTTVQQAQLASYYTLISNYYQLNSIYNSDNIINLLSIGNYFYDKYKKSNAIELSGTINSVSVDTNFQNGGFNSFNFITIKDSNNVIYKVA